jgi:hypothetical protein
MAKGKAGSIFQDLLLLVAGGVVAAKYNQMEIPVIPVKFKNLVPVVGGVFLGMKSKGSAGKMFGAGLATVGGVKMVAAIAPQLGISAVDDLEISDYMIEGGDPLSYALNGGGDPAGAGANNYTMAGVSSGSSHYM